MKKLSTIDSSTYFRLSSPDRISFHTIHRARHDKLVDTHQLIVADYLETQKRSYAEALTPVSVGRPIRPGVGSHEEEESKPVMTTTWVLSRSDYPNIRFWTKEEWIKEVNKKKASSDPTDQAGPRGRARCTLGQNVATTYIEDSEGRPIDGTQAREI